MCSIRRKKNRSEYAIFLVLFGCVILCGRAFAQVFLHAVPQESEYGRVVLDKHSSDGSPGAVVFDHWLHRSKFTCRLCHVDVGFGMQANTSGISATTNRQGFHCGACHDGKRVIDGKLVFASCLENGDKKQCARCHSMGKKKSTQYTYEKFTAKFPRGVYGVSWKECESLGLIKPIDVLEGLSIKKAPLKSRQDFAIQPNRQYFTGVRFSHEAHSIWNGCEVCHPEIFPTTKKGSISYSMYQISQGRYCGACHGKVAFPVNSCNSCHSGGPSWVEGPTYFP